MSRSIILRNPFGAMPLGHAATLVAREFGVEVTSFELHPMRRSYEIQIALPRPQVCVAISETVVEDAHHVAAILTKTIEDGAADCRGLALREILLSKHPANTLQVRGDSLQMFEVCERMSLSLMELASKYWKASSS